jgi:DNA-binding transcriptional regulator/RsmH inhibitor MraZ
MKSAYELAMERLQKSAPAVTLSDEQKGQLAEIDSRYRASIAEKELFLKEQVGKAIAAGKFEEVEQLQQQLAAETRRLEEEREIKKEKLRASFTRPPAMDQP